MQAPMDAASTHILFIGAGAIGCFYASRLHAPDANVHVSLVCRSNYKAIAQHGVQLKTHSFGEYTFQPHAVYSSIHDAATAAKAPKNGWDYVVVTTKALPDVTDDAKEIDPIVRRGKYGQTAIVLIQNGVGVEAPYRARFADNPLISAVTIASVEQTEPGVIRQNRWTRISLGAYSDGLGGRSDSLKALSKKGDESVRRFIEILTKQGQLRDAEFYDEVGLQYVRWHKICINAAMNPSAVLSGGVGNAAMVHDPELREHLKSCMQEVFDAVPKVLGKQFPSHLATPEAILRSTERNVGGKPSMLLDWEAGRPMEVEVILGNPVRIARKHGVAMPRLQSLYALLRSAQRQRNGKDKADDTSKL